MSLSLTDRSLKFLRIFRVALLFSFQGSVHAADKLIPIRTMLYDDLSSNGEGGIWTLAPLLTTCTLSRGVPSTSWVLLHVDFILPIFLVCCLPTKRLTWRALIKPKSYNPLLSSGESGIRTHAPLRTNGFQDRLVMTTSIPLQGALLSSAQGLF